VLGKMIQISWQIYHERIFRSVNISQSYEQISSGSFLWLTVYYRAEVG